MPAILLEVRHAFEKRDNMGFPIHPLAIVLIAVLGAGFLVACAYAVASSYRSAGEVEAGRSIGQEQYMREVRARNMDGIMAQSVGAHYQRSRRAPLSSVATSSKT